MPEVQKGAADTPPGQGEQLPQGEAAAINEAMPPEAALQAAQGAQGVEATAPGAVGTPEFAPEDYDPTSRYTPTGDNEEILFADNPNGARPVRYSNPNRKPVPVNVIRHLPTLALMARDPQAPDSVKALYRALVDHLEREIRSQ